MKIPSLEELQTEWLRLLRQASAKESAQGPAAGELEKLLQQTVEAGAYVSNGGERAELEVLARDIADTVFQITKAYPAATIRAPRDERVRSESVIHNIPSPPNPAFTGREKELEKLHQLLHKGGELLAMQTVAVHGLGGVGKTQLVVEYAWKHLSDYDAVLWVKADSPETLDEGLAALASLLSLREAAAREQSVHLKAVLSWLSGNKRWLLIADNADTAAAARAVRERLPPNLPGQVLVTSRLSHWPVNMPDLRVDFLLPDDATRFLLHRTAKEGHQAGDEASAQLLAEDLGNLPLALEQAAAFIIEMRWNFSQYSEQFRDARAELLSYEGEGGTRYPTSVAKTWSVTLDQLSPLARTLFRCSAWFAPDGIPRGLFSSDHGVLADALSEAIPVSNLAIDKGLGELDRFSLTHLTDKTVSVHRLLQAVEQDSLTAAERRRWLLCAIRLFNAFAPGSPKDVRSWGIWMQLSRHAETLIAHAAHNGADELPTAVAASNLGLFLQERAAYTQAELPLRLALAIYQEHGGPDHSDVARALINLAELLQATNRLDEAEPLINRARDICQRKLGPGHPAVAECLNNLAEIFRAQGHYAKAEPLYQQALTIWQNSLGREHPDVAKCLINLAELYRAQGHYPKAEPLHELALAICQHALGPDHPDVATSLNHLAALYYDQGQYAKAEPIYQQALAILQKVLGPEHPRVANSLNNLALLYHDQSEYTLAEPLYQRALAIREKVLGPEHPHVATSLNNLAELYRAQGHYELAESLYARALAIWENALGLEHPNVANSLKNLARLHRDQGRYGAAEPLFVKALAIQEKVLGPEHPNVATSFDDLAVLYYAQGRYDKAEPLYQHARAIREKALGFEHPDVAQSLDNLAQLYFHQGKFEMAQTLYERVLEIRQNILGPEHPDVAASRLHLADCVTHKSRSNPEPL